MGGQLVDHLELQVGQRAGRGPASRASRDQGAVLGRPVAVGDVFVVGHGIDHAKQYRHLPYLGAIE